MYDFEELDRAELEAQAKEAKKMSFFAKLAYCWIIAR